MCIPLILDEPGYFLPWPVSSEFSESTSTLGILEREIMNVQFATKDLKPVHEGALYRETQYSSIINNIHTICLQLASGKDHGTTGHLGYHM